MNISEKNKISKICKKKPLFKKISKKIYYCFKNFLFIVSKVLTLHNFLQCKQDDKVFFNQLASKILFKQ